MNMLIYLKWISEIKPVSVLLEEYVMNENKMFQARTFTSMGHNERVVTIKHV